jgi:hypothetical protein
MKKPTQVILPDLSRIFEKIDKEYEDNIFDRSLRQWLAHSMMLDRAERWSRVLAFCPHTVIELPESHEFLVTLYDRQYTSGQLEKA